MASQVNPTPAGYYSITPYLIIRSAAEAISKRWVAQRLASWFT